MIDVFKELYEASSVVDLIYLIITILSLIKCYKKGFVLSILSMAKWLLAYVITLIIFTLISHVICRNQFANFGHKEKSFSLFSKFKKGPIKQATKLAKTPEPKYPI